MTDEYLRTIAEAAINTAHTELERAVWPLICEGVYGEAGVRVKIDNGCISWIKRVYEEVKKPDS